MKLTLSVLRGTATLNNLQDKMCDENFRQQIVYCQNEIVDFFSVRFLKMPGKAPNCFVADQRFILATGMPLTTFSADRIFAALYSEKTNTPTAPTTIR